MSKIFVDWRRLSSGLWRVPRGDISGAYCVDVFPKLKAFIHEGKTMTCLGTSTGPMGYPSEASVHPLLPTDTDVELQARDYSWEGRAGVWRGRRWLLGEEQIFQSRKPETHEWQALLRSHYADGGSFASQSMYGEFLKAAADLPYTPQRNAAVQTELASEFAEFTKAQLKHMLDDELAANSPAPQLQLDLGL